MLFKDLCFVIRDLVAKMSEEREDSIEQDLAIENENDSDDVVIINEDEQASPKPFSSFLANVLNEEEQDELYVELPEIPAIRPLLDPPPVMHDPVQQFRPSNWRGLMAAIQNEPIDPIQVICVNLPLKSCFFSLAKISSRKHADQTPSTRFDTSNQPIIL